MLNNYLVYLQVLNEKLNNFFEKQQPYIYCKKGCSLCCRNAQFPYSQIEFEYLQEGIRLLNPEKKDIIQKNIETILQKKSEFQGESFKYDCPFLINNECSVYKYRGIICRSFGLLTLNDNGKMSIPFCCFKGLNYSNVMDGSGDKISEEKYQHLNIEEIPRVFNVSYDFLTNSDFERGFNFSFGDKKPLIEWFMD